MPRRGNTAGRRDDGRLAADTDAQSVHGPRHDSRDASFDVVLGTADQMIQRLQSPSGRRARPPRHAITIVVLLVVVVVFVVNADFVQDGLPAQLERQVVEERADRERAADERTQLP